MYIKYSFIQALQIIKEICKLQINALKVSDSFQALKNYGYYFNKLDSQKNIL